MKIFEWPLPYYKELKLTRKPFTGHTLHSLLIQMQINISLGSSGMRRKQNYDIVFGFTSDTAVLTFTFSFLSYLLFSLFLPFCFSFAGHLIDFILVGNVFGKAFRISGLDERKGRWLVEKDFHESFQVNVTRFFAFFSTILD